ncbi:hypothetical protein C8R45DRAFT_478335 [Mycena sanguinolenta]|nr:hypothetical protein C8R45DRAFT_478335 [Mycena sanguinolenta]
MLTAAATSSLAMESDPSAMPFTISPRISSVSSGKSSAASSGISSGIVSYYRAVPSIDYRAVSEMQFTHLDRYLRAYLAKESPNSRSTARQKLTRLTIQQFHELSTDVHDELHRRKNEKEVPFLPVDEKFHPKRNQARQKLATLPTTRFQDLASDVHFELARRYPGFKENGSSVPAQTTTTTQCLTSQTIHRPEQTAPPQRPSKVLSASHSTPWMNC